MLFARLRRLASRSEIHQPRGGQTGLGQCDLLLDLRQLLGSHAPGGFDLLAVRRNRSRGDHGGGAELLAHGLKHNDRRLLAAVFLIRGNGQRERMLAERPVEGHGQAGLAHRIRLERHGRHLVAGHIFADFLW